MARPDDFELFAQLHLSLLPDGAARTQTMSELARRYQVSLAELTRWLIEGRIDAATASRTDYDLPGAHAEAQVLALLGDGAATLAFARKTYDEYRARLGHERVLTFAGPDDKTAPDKIEISDVPIVKR